MILGIKFVSFANTICINYWQKGMMFLIKGVNKQILEVTNTESPYFERIIFFVRPESLSVSDATLHSEAEKLARTKSKPPRLRKSPRQIAMSIAYSLLGVGAGIGVMLIMNSVIR